MYQKCSKHSHKAKTLPFPNDDLPVVKKQVKRCSNIPVIREVPMKTTHARRTGKQTRRLSAGKDAERRGFLPCWGRRKVGRPWRPGRRLLTNMCSPHDPARHAQALPREKNTENVYSSFARDHQALVALNGRTAPQATALPHRRVPLVQQKEGILLSGRSQTQRATCFMTPRIRKDSGKTKPQNTEQIRGCRELGHRSWAACTGT